MPVGHPSNSELAGVLQHVWRQRDIINLVRWFALVDSGCRFIGLIGQRFTTTTTVYRDNLPVM